jgi:hypothetical protein
VLLNVQTVTHAVPFFALLQPTPLIFLRQTIFMLLGTSCLFSTFVDQQIFVVCIGLVIQNYVPVIKVLSFPVLGSLYKDLAWSWAE